MEPRLISRGNRIVGILSHDQGHSASMEPRLISRGNRLAGPPMENERGASMEPRLISRGNAGCSTGDCHGSHASMEPRLISRGNGVPLNSLVVKDLQPRLRAVATRFTSNACPTHSL